MERSRPDKFSNELERWVYRKCAPSIFFVEFRPEPSHVYNRLGRVSPFDEDDQVEVARRWKESQVTRYSTAFAVEPVQVDPLHVYAVTCAHVLGPVFSPAAPITSVQIQEMYDPHIMCDHREATYQDGQEDDDERHYTRGTVRAISMDLILIQITKVHMLNHCLNPHPPMFLALRFPSPLKKVVMISWPRPERNRTAFTGETSHTGRRFEEMNPHDPFGFTTRISEVKIASEKGCSGASLLNGAAEVAGALHGGDGNMSYFVSLASLRQTFTEWGIRT